jgi:hypothetical protein
MASLPTERFFSIDRVKLLVRRDKKILRREEERERNREKKYTKVVVEVGKKNEKMGNRNVVGYFSSS